MHSLVVTFMVGLVGLVSIAFGFLYKQDKYPGLTWYQVLKNDLAVRILFWVVGVLFVGYGGLFQFWM